MKKLIVLLLATMMIVSMIPVMAISTSAAVEGLWTTYQGAGSYPEPDDEPDTVYAPESGYEYTSEGFTVIQPDWGTTCAPFATASTKEPQPLKDGIYVKFRVDDYSYGGPEAVDHWICITLNTGKVEEDGSVTGKIDPGNTKYGGGWLTLLRGIGDGNATALPHNTDPKTENFGGTFVNHGGATAITAELDDEGREIYTFEVNWTGSEYEIKVNGVVLGGQAQTTTLLEKLNPNGDFFVGITLRDSYKGEGAASGFTILEYGTSASDATKPVGEDEKDPEENGFIDYPIIPSDTIDANMPAILWSPETYKLTSGNNVNFTAKGDNTWAASATEALVFFSLSPKRKWSYDAEEFPVFGIMLRNLWVDTGTLWYAAGTIPGPTDGYTMDFSVYDGRFYGEDDEYVFVPYDMTGLWEGRINAVRLDMNIVDESTRDFDLCFAGMFRSEAEAYAYAEAWITNVTGEAPEVGGDDETEDVTVGGDESVEDTTAASGEVEDTTAASGDVENTTAASGDNAGNNNDAEATTAADGEGDKDEESGCGAVVGFGAVAVLAAAAAAVALKKKD